MTIKKQHIVYGLALAAIVVFTYLPLSSRNNLLEMVKIEGGTPAIFPKKDAPQLKPLYIGFIPQGNTVFFENTGFGILQENPGRIFDPFFTTKKEGTGLGLSTVNRIIENHKSKCLLLKMLS